MMVTLSVMAIVGSMGTMQITTVRRSLQGDGAMRLAMTQLNRAREMAITQRRNMEVQFVGNNWIRIVRNDVPSTGRTSAGRGLVVKPGCQRRGGGGGSCGGLGGQCGG